MYTGACKGTGEASDQTVVEFEYNGRTTPVAKEAAGSTLETSNIVAVTNWVPMSEQLKSATFKSTLAIPQLSEDAVIKQSGHCVDSDIPLTPSEWAFKVHSDLSCLASNI